MKAARWLVGGTPSGAARLAASVREARSHKAFWINIRLVRRAAGAIAGVRKIHKSVRCWRPLRRTDMIKKLR